MSFQVGTDVGGTFTDLWAVDEGGHFEVVKVPTTSDVIDGVLAALEEVARRFGQELAAFCGDVRRFGHGTTAGLNALLTGNLSPTGLITTAGFGDTLEIGRMKRQVAGLTDMEIGDYFQRGRWSPVVPRHLVVEVPERIDRNGRILEPLDEERARSAIDALARTDVHAIAVCTLWSQLEPAHERRLGELIRERIPAAYVALSHEVSPVTGEYARMSTTAINAALGPVLASYAERLQAALRDLGLRVPISMMTSGGGVLSPREVVTLPVSVLMSGPAAGVARSRMLGEELGHDQLLSIDVGGTSFDVGTIVAGTPLMRTEMTLAGADVRHPAIDIDTVGAGGGSIAEVVDGSLRVGPRSAGAIPGPACYGRGGELATATDADLLLGTLAVEDLSGGPLQPDADAAARAVHDHVAVPLGMSTREAAWGIRRVLDSRMADLLRTATIERGRDPRAFVMVASGGQGPAHAWSLAQELGIRQVIVPPTATVHSAVGTATSQLHRFVDRPAYLRLPPGQPIAVAAVERLGDAVASAGSEARSLLDRPSADVQVTVSMRFRGQAHHLDVPLTVDLEAPDDLLRLVERFERDYEALYGAGAAFRAAGFEILGVRATATSNQELLTRPRAHERLEARSERSVVFDDPSQPITAPVYHVERPAGGQKVDGPALIVLPGQTAVVPPGARATTGDGGDITIRFRLEEGTG